MVKRLFDGAWSIDLGVGSGRGMRRQRALSGLEGALGRGREAARTGHPPPRSLPLCLPCSLTLPPARWSSMSRTTPASWHRRAGINHWPPRLVLLTDTAPAGWPAPEPCVPARPHAVHAVHAVHALHAALHHCSACTARPRAGCPQVPSEGRPHHRHVRQRQAVQHRRAGGEQRNKQQGSRLQRKWWQQPRRKQRQQRRPRRRRRQQRRQLPLRRWMPCSEVP